MPSKEARDKKPMQRLVPEERGLHGEPAGYDYDFESRVHACERMSLNVNRITYKLNKAQSWSLSNQRRMIEHEEGWREGKLRLESDHHRELLRGYAAYQLVLEQAAKKSCAQHPAGQGSAFGRYGLDQNHRKLAPIIDAIKKTIFSPTVLRRRQAQMLLQQRKQIREIDRTLPTSAVLTFHRKGGGNREHNEGSRASSRLPSMHYGDKDNNKKAMSLSVTNKREYKDAIQLPQIFTAKTVQAPL